ncbi:MAG TPA: hypothetical protein P5511_09280, partial [Candidatus Goldiibacteriota bacterium]|nr:hypothetical protein [Candidatus Goldiibacteriota bacterium]
NVSGQDANTGSVVSSSSTNINAVVQERANLVSEVISTPENAGIGWTITAVMNVYNTGEAQAVNVAPAWQVPSGTGQVTLISSPSSPVTINGGAAHGFTWTYQATAFTGSVIFSGNATGNDANNNNALSSNYSSDTSWIQNQATIAASMHIMPATISTGQVFTIAMHVTNTAGANGAPAVNVIPPAFNALTRYGSAGFSYYSGPQPVSAVVAGGASVVFTWTVSATTTGDMAFEGEVTANDSLTGAALSAVPISETRSVIKGATLSASMAVYPSSVNLGSVVTVTLTVTNSAGSASANNVSPTPVNLSPRIGGGGVQLLTSPSPINSDIAGGASRTYTWTFSAVGTGTVNFSARAIGTDANSLILVSTNSVMSNTLTIANKAVLAASAYASPLIVNVGQEITVRVYVTN